MSGLYNKFATDKGAEEKGVVLDYGVARVRVARAGGSNRKYAIVAEKKARPFRRALATNTAEPEVVEKWLREVFAETVILDWQTKVDDEWKRGIEGPDGKLLPFEPEYVCATLEALPDLWADIQRAAMDQTLFRADALSEEAGN